MLTIINTRLGENKGVPRVWLEGSRLSSSFSVGQQLNVVIDRVNHIVKLEVAQKGRISVSKRVRNGREHPLIELKDTDLKELFGAIGVLLRVVIKDGVASIEAHKFSQNIVDRVKRFNHKIVTGEPLSFGSLCTGAGILDSAVHDGLEKVGIASYAKFIVEQEKKYIDAMVSNQSKRFRSDSIIIESPIEFVDLKRNPPKLDVCISGLPCTGASIAGLTKNKIKFAEDHETAGACFFYFLQFIDQCQPSLIILENVGAYLNTSSMAVICSVLTCWGYDLDHAIVNGVVHGSLENRDRLCLVATTKGLKPFKMSNLKPSHEKPAFVGDILEDIPLDSDVWRTYSYLEDKAIRDKAAGKGFARTIIDGTETSVPTLRRLYHKAGSCDTFVGHPDGVRSRLFTPKEHCAIKQVPFELIDGVSNSVAHEILGQSVCYPVFTALGVAIGNWILSEAFTEAA